MKRLLLFCMAILCLGISVQAQKPHATYNSLPLSVEYYNERSTDQTKNGKLVITNKFNATAKAHITVTVRITYTENVAGIDMKKNKTLVLCDDEFSNIRPGTEIYLKSNRGIIKGGPEKEGKKYDYHIDVSSFSQID